MLGGLFLGRLLSEAKTAAGGSIAGISHVPRRAHLAGAGAGLVLVIPMRVVIANAEGGRRAPRARSGFDQPANAATAWRSTRRTSKPTEGEVPPTGCAGVVCANETNKKKTKWRAFLCCCGSRGSGGGGGRGNIQHAARTQQP